jgi:hypothetical protein
MIATILAKIFDNNTQIQNEFINTGALLNDISDTSANYLPLYDGSKFVNSAVYSSSGNVGIGTTNPSTKLHIQGSSIADLRLSETVNG